ncbi:MAG: hypothetical protein GC204_14540 [Chloroflexi bacterium]|nr:hypothetical protein [Chloroflexota bacterium]
MIQFILRTIFVLALSFALTVGAIVAQPRDDAAMRAFFAPPPGCAAPCFIGIRPGVTTYDQALAILRAQPWIDGIKDESNALSWTWNGTQPGFVSDFENNFLLARIDFANGVVESIRVPTTTRWADFYFLFGAPDRFVLFSGSAPSVHYRIYDAAYFTHGFEVETTLRCPINSREAAWYSTVFMTWPVVGPVLTAPPDTFVRC